MRPSSALCLSTRMRTTAWRVLCGRCAGTGCSATSFIVATCQDDRAVCYCCLCGAVRCGAVRCSAVRCGARYYLPSCSSATLSASALFLMHYMRKPRLETIACRLHALIAFTRRIHAHVPQAGRRQAAVDAFRSHLRLDPGHAEAAFWAAALAGCCEGCGGKRDVHGAGSGITAGAVTAGVPAATPPPAAPASLVAGLFDSCEDLSTSDGPSALGRMVKSRVVCCLGRSGNSRSSCRMAIAAAQMRTALTATSLERCSTGRLGPSCV
jgi:hypothetical protein